MPDRRGSRFALEVLFLIALAVGLTLAHLSPIEIAGVMLLGWVIVAAIEWASWRDEPHYGAGLPPRYYVPQVNLPPAQPLEQVSGYPEARGYREAQREEAPTWIASAALRDEMLGAWPVATPPVSPEGEPEPVATTGPESSIGPGESTQPEPAPEPEPEPEPEAVAELHEPADETPADEPVDPWLVAELPAEPLLPQPLWPEPPLSEPSEPEPAHEAEPEPVLEAEPEPVRQPEPEPEPESELDVVLARSASGLARYHLDPLAEPAPRRRFSRGAPEAQPAVEVPSRPDGVRALPGRPDRQD